MHQDQSGARRHVTTTASGSAPLRESRDRSEWIAMAAYARFLARGSAHGRDVQDWLLAEAGCASSGTQSAWDECRESRRS
jgi:hypothetical protein